MKLDELLKMDLQFFADDDGDGNGDDNPGDQDDNPGGDDDKGGENGGVELPQTQSELDALINKANQTAIKNATKNMVPRDEVDQLLDKKLTEAEKLRNMSAEEKEEHERSKLEKELAEYKRKENLREMSKEAQKSLEEQGVAEFGDLLDYIVTEDAEGTKERVDIFATAIKKRDEKIKEELQKQLGTRTILDGNSAANSSLGAQLAEKHNEQHKEPDNDPWKIN